MCEALIKSLEVNKKEKGFTVLDVPSAQFIKALATFFKEKNVITIPKYAPLVKTSRSNDCEPIDPDYVYYKAAAICRKLYLTKSHNLGVGSLRSMFSKKERRGSQPPRTFRSGGKLIRDLVTQLRGKEYIENYGKNEEDASNHGLYLTRTGRSQLDKIASGLMNKK